MAENDLNIGYGAAVSDASLTPEIKPKEICEECKEKIINFINQSEEDDTNGMVQGNPAYSRKDNRRD